MRREWPAQRRARLARTAPERTLDAFDRAMLERAIYDYRRTHPRERGALSLGRCGVIFKHVYDSGPKAKARGGLAAFLPLNPILSLWRTPVEDP